MFIFNGRYDRFSKTLVFTVMAIVQIMVLLENRYTDRFFKVFSCKFYTVLKKKHLATCSRVLKEISLFFSPQGYFSLAMYSLKHLLRKNPFSNSFFSGRFCIKFSKALEMGQFGRKRACWLKRCQILTN